jgi:hypothetical protein
METEIVVTIIGSNVISPNFTPDFKIIITLGKLYL